MPPGTIRREIVERMLRLEGFAYSGESGNMRYFRQAGTGLKVLLHKRDFLPEGEVLAILRQIGKSPEEVRSILAAMKA